MASDFEFRRIVDGDDPTFDAMLDVFSDAFDDAVRYSDKRPGKEYRRNLLSRDTFVALAAMVDGTIAGALVAYELIKFEQECSEFYIFDLAVAECHRRKGVAVGLISALKEIAAKRGGYVIYVQADYGDEPAIALYSKLGRREDVMHFDIAVD